MKKKTVLIITCTMLLVSGCGKHPKRKGKISKSSASPKVTASIAPSASPKTTAAPVVPAENPQTDAGNENTGTTTETHQNTQNNISGNYLIISYEDASGNKETFDPGKDDSIIGSSSIVLKNDGNCEFNMPGFGENTGCTWSGNTLHAGGADTQFSVNGNEMTVQENGDTYVFQKAG